MIPQIPLSILGRKIAWSAFAQYAGKAIQMALSIATIKLIINFLSVHDYGVYGAIMECALFFSVVANLGIFAQLVRKMADNPTDGKVFVNGLFLRLITALILFVGGFAYIAFSGNEVIFIIGTALFLGALLLDYLTNVCDAALQVQYRMGVASLSLLAGKLLFCLAVLLITKTSLISWSGPAGGMIFLFIAILLGSLLTLGLSLFFVGQKVKLKWQLDWNFMLEIFKIGLPFGIINILNNLYFRFIPDYFAYKILPTESFATWNISFKIAQVASLFSTFLMFSVLPGLKEYIDRKEWRNVEVLYKKVWKILLASGVLLFLIGVFIGPFLIELLTHKKYFLPELWFVLPMMLLLAAISYGYDLILVTLFAFEEEKWLLKREGIAVGIALIFALLAWFINAEIINDTVHVYLERMQSFGLQLPLFLILIGAIFAESFMFIVGFRKIKKLLLEKS